MRRYAPAHTFGARTDDGWTYRGIDTAVAENEWLRAVILSGQGVTSGALCSSRPTPSSCGAPPPAPRSRGPRFAPTTADGDALWLDRYEGGWQSVFPNGGDPSSVKGARLGLHVESSMLPWNCAISAEGPDLAELTLTVRLVRTPITARRTIGLRAGSPVLSVRETLLNTGIEALPVLIRAAHHLRRAIPVGTLQDRSAGG